MSPGEAVMELTRLGFCFRLDNKGIMLGFEGEQTPDPAAVASLLDIMRRHREDVHLFLRCHCAKCGGVVFGTFAGMSRCMGCDW